jgi:1-deoxyxylulose-5-phosphate synthase
MTESAGGVDWVPLGQTDLRVSRLCQGTAFRHLERHADDRRAEGVLRWCLERGITFFDSASAYGWGGSEELLGKAVAGRRDQVVICTKVTPSQRPGTGGMPEARLPFTSSFLRDSLEASLRRLGTDYIDLFLLHKPDGLTPPASICRSMEALVRAGKTRYWGVSNHEAEFVQRLHDAARQAGTSPPAAVEDYYNVAGHHLDEHGRSRTRRLEGEMLPVVRACGMGLIAFSPMDTGQLAPELIPEPGSPLARLQAALDLVAGELGVSRAQVCVAWVLTRAETTSVLSGAESPEHVDKVLAGTELVLAAEIRARLDQASIAYSQELEACHNGS